MQYVLYNEKREKVQESEDSIKVVTMLTAELFNRYIAKTKNVKQLQYQYNYSDTQKITLAKGYHKISFKFISDWLISC